MKKALFFQAVLKFLLALISVSLLIFIPAGSLYFFNGWLLIIVLFLPIFLAGLVMIFKAPELLKKRLNVNENQPKQKNIIKMSALIFISSFILAGLNYRFAFCVFPFAVSVFATFMFLLAYLLYAFVLSQNKYLSRTVEIQEKQIVIDTGLYKIVRHPMYSATLILFFSIPFILASPVSIIPFLFYPCIIVKRIKLEETLLEKELAGYKEYKDRVRYRLIPFIW